MKIKFCPDLTGKEEIKATLIGDGDFIIQYGKEGKGSPGQGSATENLAIRRTELEEKCKTIEQTAIEADPELYQYILEGVTTDYATYRYLKDAKKIPCGDQKYYRTRRKFYWLLSKKV